LYGFLFGSDKLIVDVSDLKSLSKSIEVNPFIVFEGINGCGKSTFLSKIEACAKLSGFDTVITREPGGSSIGGNLREMLLAGNIKLEPLAELFLFSADRAQHLKELIKPSLASGSLVLSDRYYYSTVAFQSFGRGLSLELVKSVCKHATGGFEPSLVVLVDVSVETAFTRLGKRQGVADRFESEARDFQERVRQGYLDMAKNMSSTPFLLIDNEKDLVHLDSLADQIWMSLSSILCP
jgi:dTMP kinase